MTSPLDYYCLVIGVNVTLSVSCHNSTDSALLWKKHCSREGGAWYMVTWTRMWPHYALVIELWTTDCLLAMQSRLWAVVLLMMWYSVQYIFRSNSMAMMTIMDTYLTAQFQILDRFVTVQQAVNQSAFLKLAEVMQSQNMVLDLQHNIWCRYNDCVSDFMNWVLCIVTVSKIQRLFQQICTLQCFLS